MCISFVHCSYIEGQLGYTDCFCMKIIVENSMYSIYQVNACDFYMYTIERWESQKPVLNVWLIMKVKGFVISFFTHFNNLLEIWS